MCVKKSLVANVTVLISEFILCGMNQQDVSVVWQWIYKIRTKKNKSYDGVLRGPSWSKPTGSVKISYVKNDNLKKSKNKTNESST